MNSLYKTEILCIVKRKHFCIWLRVCSISSNKILFLLELSNNFSLIQRSMKIWSKEWGSLWDLNLLIIRPWEALTFFSIDIWKSIFLIIMINIIFSFLSLTHRISQWFLTGVWVTASLLKYPGLFSVYYYYYYYSWY